MFAVLLLLGAAPLGCSGCSEENGNNGNSTSSDAGPDAADAAVDTALPQICEPGEFVGCRDENTPAINVCNEAGTAVEAGSCPTSPLQVCRNDECVAVNCIPETRRCDSETQPQQCDAEGNGFVDMEACPEGSRCENGNCLNRCEIAELTNSYIGCEYWAVELENHLLDDNEETGNPLPDDRIPPFAVVLANTSTTYDAEITVFEALDRVAQAVPARTVGTDIQQPGLDLVTVYSEVVDGNGDLLYRIEGPIQDLVLPRGSTMTLILPRKEMAFGASSLEPLAYKVESTQPVVAYQFNPLCCNYNFTNDASLLLPKSALTENYMHLGYAVWAGATGSRLEEPFSGTLTVLATEPDTQVTITLSPSKQAGRPYSEMIYPSNSGAIQGPDPNGVIRATLQPHDALNIASSGVSPVEDLTGSSIVASKPVAVFGGHTCAFVPFANPACDHLESQLFPLETWGNRFVAAPLKRRGPEGTRSREGTYWKFLAIRDDTEIRTGFNLEPPNALPPADEGVTNCRDLAADPTTGKFVLDRGQTCEFGTRDMFVVEATNPITMGAFLSGQNSVTDDAQFGDRAGDPAFFMVPPEEQYRTDYAFLTPATYFVSYVTAVIRPGTLLTLDGELVDLESPGVDVGQTPDGQWQRLHIEVEPGPHTIAAPLPFGIVVYGYDDYVSYAYTGGLDLTKLNEF
jgi:hypothetical protein